MTEQEDKMQKDSNQDFNNLIDKQLARLYKDIEKHLTHDLNPALLLLKGHLLIEYYLGILLILFDEDREILNKTFFEKISKCRDKKILETKNIESIIALNKLRNKMSHELEYSVSESDIDSISMFFQKEYIINKLNHDQSESAEKLLHWFFTKNLNHIIGRVILKLDQENNKQK